jgi:hypothetical protein
VASINSILLFSMIGLWISKKKSQPLDLSLREGAIRDTSRASNGCAAQAEASKIGLVIKQKGY